MLRKRSAGNGAEIARRTVSDLHPSRFSWKKFPFWRVLLAMAVASIFPPFVLFALSMSASRPALSDLALLPLVSILYAWPGCLTFLLFGLPTLYFLLRAHRTGFVTFAFFGALYTALPWVILQAIQHPPRHKFLQLVPTFAEIGIVNGIFTRLIVVGLRSKPASRETRDGPGTSNPDVPG